MRIILLGAPGSGKGTLGEKITQAYGFPRIATGDLLRQAVRDGTPLGRRAEEIMKAGGLVSDEIVTGIVRERIFDPDCRPGYILDGFPRTIAQAEALERLDGGRAEVVIALEVAPATLVARLSGRRVCPACPRVYNLTSQPPRLEGICDDDGHALVQRPDDAESVVLERIRVYERETAKLWDYYRAKPGFRPVDGEGPANEVFARASAVLETELEAVREERRA
jgi:adenylate kinase